jgi:uncharacterized iron-regulated membrane protein
MITRPIAGLDSVANSSAAHRMVWRWHFYAGLFCAPFIVVLCLSGAIYLFKPQTDAYFDRNYDNLALSEASRPLDSQVEAALTANPGARLSHLEFRANSADAARVHLVTAEGDALRVMVRPDTLEIMKVEAERSRLSDFMADLHGSLLLGSPGSIAVELAGAWAIVMVITGLYLWWPRGSGPAGVLYPRLASGRVFLRDLHAVTGFWLSTLALFYLISALPWTTVWGQGFKYIRSVGQAREVKQDWPTGPAEQQAKRSAAFRDAAPSRGEAASDDHAGHAYHTGGDVTPGKISGFDEVAARIASLDLAEPVFIKPPSAKKPNWTAQSNSQNRPLRETLEFDPERFEQVSHKRFGDRPLIDQIIGVGIAAHEGQLFGWFNQLLGLMTATGYLVLVVTSLVMWWRRRPRGSLGAPPALARAPRLAPFVIGVILIMGVFLPVLGTSLVIVLAIELVFRRFAPNSGRWLGLTPINSRAVN